MCRVDALFVVRCDNYSISFVIHFCSVGETQVTPAVAHTEGISDTTIRIGMLVATRAVRVAAREYGYLQEMVVGEVTNISDDA